MAPEIIQPTGRGLGKKKLMDLAKRMYQGKIFGMQTKTQVEMIPDRQLQELLREYMKNPERLNSAVAACAVTADEIKEATDRIITLARGHHVRLEDGTVIDVSNNPRYKCNQTKED